MYSNSPSERRPSVELAEIILRRWGIVYNAVEDAQRSTRRTYPKIGIVLPIIKPIMERLKPEVSASIVSEVVQETANSETVATQLSTEQQARIDSARIAIKAA